MVFKYRFDKPTLLEISIVRFHFLGFDLAAVDTLTKDSLLCLESRPRALFCCISTLHTFV